MERRRRSVEMSTDAGDERTVRAYPSERGERISRISDGFEEVDIGRAGKCEFDKFERPLCEYKELFCAKPEAVSAE